MTEEIIQTCGATIVKRTYVPLSELLPLTAPGLAVIDAMEQGLRLREIRRKAPETSRQDARGGSW